MRRLRRLIVLTMALCSALSSSWCNGNLLQQWLEPDEWSWNKWPMEKRKKAEEEENSYPARRSCWWYNQATTICRRHCCAAISVYFVCRLLLLQLLLFLLLFYLRAQWDFSRALFTFFTFLFCFCFNWINFSTPDSTRKRFKRLKKILLKSVLTVKLGLKLKRY